MGSITSLLRRLVALLTALVMTMTGSDVTQDNLSLVSVDYPFQMLAIAQSSLVAYALVGNGNPNGPYFNTSGYTFFNFGGINAGVYSVSVMAGYSNTYVSGTQITVSWGSNLTGYTNLSSSSVSTGWQSSRPSQVYDGKPSFKIFDSQFRVLASVSSSSTSVSFTLDHDVSFIGIGYSVTTVSNGSNYQLSLGVYNFDIISVPPSDPLQDSLDAIRVGVSDIANSNRGILNSIDNLAGAIGTPSAMEQFEQKYLDSMADQLDKVESMLSPDNPALPNNGDVAGFVSDIQDGLGLSGSSFNASEFAEATSVFGGSSATSAGGPWEFFTQAVADSLSGDTSSVGLADDDYIYAWLEQMQGRYSSWHSSSP